MFQPEDYKTITNLIESSNITLFLQKTNEKYFFLKPKKTKNVIFPHHFFPALKVLVHIKSKIP